MDSVTFEETDTHLSDWLRRRSRRIEGQIQTWLVQMRHPLRLRGELGARGWSAFQLTIGGSVFPALVGPICWLIVVLWLAGATGLTNPLLPSYVFYAAAIDLIVWNFSLLYGMGAASSSRGLVALVRRVSLQPLYALLISLAAWKAVAQLATRSRGAEPAPLASDAPAVGEPAGA